MSIVKHSALVSADLALWLNSYSDLLPGQVKVAFFMDSNVGSDASMSTLVWDLPTKIIIKTKQVGLLSRLKKNLLQRSSEV